MKRSFTIGSIFGIPIGINYTWFLIFALVLASLGLEYYPASYPYWPIEIHWIVALFTTLLFFASVVAHELSHSVVSMAFGVPVRSITLFIFGGVAEISREARTPKAELLMAAAGPFCSLTLAAIFIGIALITPPQEPLSALMWWLGLVNLMLATFNLLPGFPLDGGRVFRSILWRILGDYRRATRIATLSGQGIAYLLIFGGILYGFNGQWLDGLWIAFIGWFLENAASSSYRQMMLADTLRGVKAKDIMTAGFPAVPHDMTVDRLVREYIIPGGRRSFLVIEDLALAGIITLSNIKEIKQDVWPTTPVSMIMTPVERLITTTPEEDTASILERMDEADVNQMPVVVEGRVVGMVARDSLLHSIRLRSELKV